MQNVRVSSFFPRSLYSNTCFLDMSPFDSPEDDPLLNDSLSSSDGGDEDAEGDPLFSADVDLDDETIFEEDEAQIVVRSEEGITSGELAGINAALRNFSRRGLVHLLDKLAQLNELLRKGWALDRIEFRNPPSASLAFIVRKTEAEE